jgi:Mn2+/Fe2+ NRAMP family transporter
MSDASHNVQTEKEILEAVEGKGSLSRLLTYMKLSGPGWLQSALTLGGGSLAGSLYLGVLGGYHLLWLQLFAMLMGVIMLSAISYVTLVSGERPFQAIKNHINPVLAWGWALASLMANMVWVLPQYSLLNGVVQQNLMPGLLGKNGILGDFNSKLIISLSILALTTFITFCYSNKGFGIRLYDWILKIMVHVIILCFLGVVIKLSIGTHGLPWGEIFSGLIPDFTLLFKPVESFQPYLDAVQSEAARAYWAAYIVSNQCDVMIAAASSAVGINMTFLLPYSMISRGWDKSFRGLAVFDLSTGMLIPFVIVTSCIIIASGTQFHTKITPGLLDAQGNVIAEETHPKLKSFQKLIGGRSNAVLESENPISNTERQLAAMLITRDAGDLSSSLTPLTGKTIANWIFGIGVVGMTISSITLLMLISGFVICEMFNLPHNGWQHKLGTLCAATGVLGPFIWADAAFWLAVPTSVFGFMLLPLAYITFFLMMNSKSLLGDNMPTGGTRILCNVLMGFATVVTTVGAIWQAYSKAGNYSILAIVILIGLIAITHFMKKPNQKTQAR